MFYQSICAARAESHFPPRLDFTLRGGFNHLLRWLSVRRRRGGTRRSQMNGLLWIAQLTLAGVFLFTAASKLFAYKRVVAAVESRKGRLVAMTQSQAVLVAIAEIIGAIGVLMPSRIAPPHLVVIAASAWLALIMAGASIYHARRGESATPNVTLILLALFVIVGRWPR